MKIMIFFFLDNFVFVIYFYIFIFISNFSLEDFVYELRALASNSQQ